MSACAAEDYRESLAIRQTANQLNAEANERIKINSMYYSQLYQQSNYFHIFFIDSFKVQFKINSI